MRPTAAVVLETALVLGLWAVLILTVPRGFFTVYLPGWLIGLALCQLQGHYEHARGTTSHYGRIYNTLCFNDGYHLEHHARPTLHWSALRTCRSASARGSRWPAVLRWLDARVLDGLERVVLSSSRLQRFVLRVHENAFRKLLAKTERIRAVTIIGGGLFPRTAIVLQRLVPAASLTILEANARHLELARTQLGSTATLRHMVFDGGALDPADLVVIPLAYAGSRELVYKHPPARVVFVHDWVWSPRGESVVVSWLLLKRLNLVVRGPMNAGVGEASR